MLRDVARDSIASKLGERTDLNDAIEAEMIVSQETRLEGNAALKPWFLESIMTEIGTTTIDDNTLALPSDFLGEIDGQGIWVYVAGGDPVWTKLRKDDFDIATERLTEPGKPKRYSLQAGDTLILHPTPDAAYSIRMRYYQKQTALTTNIENAWLANAADMMIYDVARQLAKDKLQNDKMSARYKTDFADAVQRVFVENESRKHTNRFYGMGDD